MLELDLRDKKNRKPGREIVVGADYDSGNEVTLSVGRCEDFLTQIPRGEVQLVVTSPPYNIGKRYERGKKQSIDEYIEEQRAVIKLCVERLAPSGSICWQIGNHVAENSVYPIDIMLYPIFRALGL